MKIEKKGLFLFLSNEDIFLWYKAIENKIGFILIGFAAYEDAELKRYAIENICLKIFCSFLRKYCL